MVGWLAHSGSEPFTSTVYVYIQTAKQWTHKIPLSEELGMSHMYYCYINSNIYSKVCTIAFVI